ncbi:MAG: amidohydrolase [Alicyclobacillus sp.]|nr:amidohydrolase [Alicyclobacillus sp.]
MYDVHSHFIPPAVLDWLRANPARVSAVWEERMPGKAPFLTVNGKWSFELKAEFHDAELYLQAQRTAGVERTLVSPVPQLFLYEADPAVTTEVAQVYNQALTDWTQKHPDQLRALATLPLNAPEKAAAMLERALNDGLMGAIIGPGVAGKLLSDAAFTPVWEVAHTRNAVLFLHPLLNEDPRIQRHRMPNLIGVPWETTLTALDLILSGQLDRFPGARVLLAHGGGFLPYQLGRYQKGYESWPPVRTSLQASPVEYLRRFYYDNVLWHPAALQFLQAVAGADRVLPGSDFPFDLSVWPPAAAEVAACKQFFGEK